MKQKSIFKLLRDIDKPLLFVSIAFFVFGLLNMPALCKKMLELLKENEQLFLLQSVEIPLAYVLVQMEMSGVQIDVAKLIEFGKTLQT